MDPGNRSAQRMSRRPASGRASVTAPDFPCVNPANRDFAGCRHALAHSGGWILFRQRPAKLKPSRRPIPAAVYPAAGRLSANLPIGGTRWESNGRLDRPNTQERCDHRSGWQHLDRGWDRFQFQRILDPDGAATGNMGQSLVEAPGEFNFMANGVGRRRCVRRGRQPLCRGYR